MFLTDGESSDAVDYDRIRRQATDNGAFIFSYSLGSNADKEAPKRLACENRGVFYPVADQDDLADVMARYFEFFAQGQEICNANFEMYSHSASSEVLYGACRPMYDRTAGNRNILGVSCLDVNLVRKISDMKS